MSEKKKGILCILSAAFFFALMNLFIKLSGNISTPEKAFFRNFIAIFVSGAALLKAKPEFRSFKKNFPFIFARALFGTVGVFANFYAIDHLNISDASMLNKLSPFFAIIFSYIILKEKASLPQIGCVLAAIAGALVVFRPGSGSMAAFPAFIGLMGGLNAGLAYTFLRKATSNGVNGNLIVFFFSLFSCVCCVPPMLLQFTVPDSEQIIFLVLTGLAATGGQFSITAAYTHAKAAEISVYDYTQIIDAGILGFIFLNEVPDAYSIAGSCIIIGAGIINFLAGNRTAASS